MGEDIHFKVLNMKQKVLPKNNQTLPQSRNGLLSLT